MVPRYPAFQNNTNDNVLILICFISISTCLYELSATAVQRVCVLFIKKNKKTSSIHHYTAHAQWKLYDCSSSKVLTILLNTSEWWSQTQLHLHDCSFRRRLFLVFMGACGFSPSLMNCIDGVGLVVWRFFCLSHSKMSASAQRTLSWRHLYLPWWRAALHPASMCAIIPLPPHSLHNGSTLIPHL